MIPKLKGRVRQGREGSLLAAISKSRWRLVVWSKPKGRVGEARWHVASALAADLPPVAKGCSFCD